MKKTLIFAIALLFLLAGCSEEQIVQKTAFKLKVIDSENKIAFEKDLETTKTKALPAILENNIPIEYEQQTFGAFITSIGEITPKENEYLAIYINNEYANSGISDTEITKDMILEFRVEKINKNKYPK